MILQQCLVGCPAIDRLSIEMRTNPWRIDDLRRSGKVEGVGGLGQIERSGVAAVDLTISRTRTGCRRTTATRFAHGRAFMVCTLSYVSTPAPRMHAVAATAVPRAVTQWPRKRSRRACSAVRVCRCSTRAGRCASSSIDFDDDLAATGMRRRVSESRIQRNRVQGTLFDWCRADLGGLSQQQPQDPVFKSWSRRARPLANCCFLAINLRAWLSETGEIEAVDRRGVRKLGKL